MFASTSATRKLYHQFLSKREYQVHRVADLAELLLVLVTFEVDTIILIDEGRQLHELHLAMELIKRKYDRKRLILVSLMQDYPRGIERYPSSTEFFDRVL